MLSQLNTTSTQEASLLKQAKIIGNDGNCARSVTKVLSKTIYPKIEISYLPSSVYSQLKVLTK